MIGAIERANKYNIGSLFSYFRAVVLKYCLVYNFQLHKSSSIIKYFSHWIKQVDCIFSGKTSGETQGLLLTYRNVPKWMKFYGSITLPTPTHTNREYTFYLLQKMKKNLNFIIYFFEAESSPFLLQWQNKQDIL